MQITATASLAALALASQAVAAPAGNVDAAETNLEARANAQPNIFFWDHANYQGKSWNGATKNILEWWDVAELTNRISSFKLVFAECWFYEGYNGAGNYIYAKNTHVPSIGAVWPGWNDRIKSMKCKTMTP